MTNPLDQSWPPEPIQPTEPTGPRGCQCDETDTHDDEGAVRAAAVRSRSVGLVEVVAALAGLDRTRDAMVRERKRLTELSYPSGLPDATRLELDTIQARLQAVAVCRAFVADPRSRPEVLVLARLLYGTFTKRYSTPDPAAN